MYAVAATSYEPFVRDLQRIEAPDEWFIERVPTRTDRRIPGDAKLQDHIERWRTMSACGWDLTCLVAGDSRTVVALGCRGAA